MISTYPFSLLFLQFCVKNDIKQIDDNKIKNFSYLTRNRYLKNKFYMRSVGNRLINIWFLNKLQLY